jgi:hypothetical protein
VVLTPKDGAKDLSIDLYGDLAGILEIAAHGATAETYPMRKTQEARNRRDSGIANDNHSSGRSQIKLVAGAGFEPATFGL